MEDKPVDDGPPKEDLLSKIRELETNNRKMHDEFNVQRAKLKELYVQKEAECIKLSTEVEAIKRELDDMKSKFVVVECKNENDIQLLDRKAQEEIASLQQLLQETIEEASVSKSVLDNYREENMRLKQENNDLRDEIVSHQQDTPSLAPVISHVRKTLARKLGGDSGGSHDSLDDSMRKVNKYAQEDAEVLRSLVVPLEEEIKALKEKLRSTDEELQSYRINQLLQTTTNSTETVPTIPSVSKDFKRSPSPQQKAQNEQRLQKRLSNEEVPDSLNKSTSMDHFQCDMCQNYELKLVQSQKLLNKEKENLTQLKKSLDDSKEELSKEAALRRDLEEQWQEKREAHKEEVQFLTEQVKKSEKELINLQQQFLDTKEQINKQLLRLTEDREEINKQLEMLQNDNDFLSGKYLATSEELENQYINLPNNVEELQELLLKQREELIQARAGSESEKRKCESYMDEAHLLMEQLKAAENSKREYEKRVHAKTGNLEERLKTVLMREQKYETMKEEFQRRDSEMNKQISELRVQIVELEEKNKKLLRTNGDLKGQMKILQDELATSETVQKDFVKLSQSLQMELEKFRRAESQVRWQDDDDVEKCPNCSVSFTVTCRKHHCRHCGTIYCERCLTKTVPSGPRKKPARVCDMCHTLLTPNEAPYFSQDPPQSPT